MSPALAQAVAGLLFFATALFWVQERWVTSAFEAGVLFLAAASCLILYRRPRSQRDWLLPVAAVALAGFGLVGLAAGLTVSRQDTWEATLGWVTLVALFFLVREALAERATRKSFLAAALWFACGLSLLALVQFFTSHGKIYWIIDTGLPLVLGPFRNRNHYAAFAVLILPLALWDGLRHRRRRLASACVAATLVFAVLAGGSRAGIVLMFGELALFAAIARSRARRVLPAVVVLACVLVAIGLAPWRRFADPDPLIYRREIWGATLDMIRERPWTGFGLGTFETVYPAYAKFDNGQRVDHAHNDWLEWAAEGGLPFALLLALIALWSLRQTFRQPWLAGVPAVFLHSLADYPLHKPILAAWAVTLLAAAACDSNGPSNRAEAGILANARLRSGRCEPSGPEREWC